MTGQPRSELVEIHVHDGWHRVPLLPAQPQTHFGDIDVRGVAGDRAVCIAISRIADQLRAEDPELASVGERRRADGDHRLQGAAVRRQAQMLPARLCEFIGSYRVAGVDELECPRMFAADTACVVAPRKFGSDQEFFGRVGTGSD